MHFRAATAALILLVPPAPLAANSIGFDIWPGSDPDRVISCVIRLQCGRISAAEATGLGMPPVNPARRFPAATERAAMLAALQSPVDGSIPSVSPTGARLALPPFVTVAWLAEVGDGLMTGLCIQPGPDLPDPFDRLIATLLPGGMCHRAIASLE